MFLQAYRKYSYFIAIADATWQSLVEFFVPYAVSSSRSLLFKTGIYPFLSKKKLTGVKLGANVKCDCFSWLSSRPRIWDRDSLRTYLVDRNWE